MLGAAHELGEGRLEVEPRGVGGVMIELGVGEDCDVRIELEERAVRLVRLDDDPLPCPPPGIRAGVPELASDHVGRIETAAPERVDNHGRGGRLAVRARNRDAAPQASDLTEQVGPVQLATGRRHALGVLGRDGARVDDLNLLAVGQVGGIVADARGGARRTGSRHDPNPSPARRALGPRSRGRSCRRPRCRRNAVAARTNRRS